MLNLFQHLINSMSYETLNQVQGDKKAIATQSPREGKLLGLIFRISILGHNSYSHNLSRDLGLTKGLTTREEAVKFLNENIFILHLTSYE